MPDDVMPEGTGVATLPDGRTVPVRFAWLRVGKAGNCPAHPIVEVEPTPGGGWRERPGGASRTTDECPDPAWCGRADSPAEVYMEGFVIGDGDAPSLVFDFPEGL